jgi:hypothetical protein
MCIYCHNITFNVIKSNNKLCQCNKIRSNYGKVKPKARKNRYIKVVELVGNRELNIITIGV